MRIKEPEAFRVAGGETTGWINNPVATGQRRSTIQDFRPFVLLLPKPLTVNQPRRKVAGKIKRFSTDSLRLPLSWLVLRGIFLW